MYTDRWWNIKVYVQKESNYMKGHRGELKGRHIKRTRGKEQGQQWEESGIDSQVRRGQEGGAVLRR